MILFWLCFLSAQTIPDTLGSTFPFADTIQADSLAPDTTEADTVLRVYPIPDIVQYRDQNPDNAGYLVFRSRPYDLFFDDLLQAAGMLAKNGRLVTRGRGSTARAGAAWNCRILENRIFGYFDTRLIPLAFVESMAVADGDAYLRTRLNRFDRPFSRIRFTTLGSATLYGLDLTRAITDNIGYYLSGVYSKHRPANADSEETRNAFYGDFYTCGRISSRLDFVYSDRHLPGSGKGMLYCACLTIGQGPVRTRLSYDYQLTEYDEYSARSRNARFGLETRGDHAIEPYRFQWAAWFNADDILTRAAIPSYYNERDYVSGVDLNGERRAGRFRFNAGGRIVTEFDGTVYPMPRIRLGFTPADSQEIFASLERDYRRLTVAERLGYAYAYNPDHYLLRPSPDLEQEYSWRFESGYRHKNISLTVYQDDISDYIAYRYDPLYIGLLPENISEVRVRGAELSAAIPLAWGFRFSAAGEYLFERRYELWGRYPEYSVYGTLSWVHEYGRARYEVSGWGRYLVDDRPVFYGAAAIRFIALTASVRLENVLDDEISGFTVPARNVSLSIQWEFWN